MALKWTCLLWAITCVVRATAEAIDDFQQRCLSFMPQEYVKNSTRTVLEYVPANTTLEFPDNDASCGRLSQLVSVDLCRVALSIPTSNRSVEC
jgi:feruloyl esterase